MNIINGVYSEDYNQVGGCIMKNILFIASEGAIYQDRRTGRCGWITAEGH